MSRVWGHYFIVESTAFVSYIITSIIVLKRNETALLDLLDYDLLTFYLRPALYWMEDKTEGW